MPQIGSIRGKRIVLTRSASAGDGWERALRRRGAVVYRFPTIETAAAPFAPRLARTLRDLAAGRFGWVIFTSAAGAHYLKALLTRGRIKISAKQMPSVAAIGTATARAVRAIGYRVSFIPSRPDGLALGYELAPLRPPILLLRSDIASPKLPQVLRARGARVVDLPIYRTKLLREPDPSFSKLLISQKADYLVFASPSAVKGFCMRVRGAAMKAARAVPALALGPRIATALRRAGFKDIRIARSAAIEAAANR